MHRLILTAAACVLFAGAQTRADFILEYQGTADTASTVNGLNVAAGTLLTIDATFPDLPYDQSSTGLGLFKVNEITVALGGLSYSADPATVSNYFVQLADPRFNFGTFMPVLAVNETPFAHAIYPQYISTTTAGWSATAPSPTVFNNLIEMDFNSIGVHTSTGADLMLQFDLGHSFNSQIMAVPLPSSLAAIPVGLAMLAAVEFKRRRRKTT